MRVLISATVTGLRSDLKRDVARGEVLYRDPVCALRAICALDSHIPRNHAF